MDAPTKKPYHAPTLRLISKEEVEERELNKIFRPVVHEGNLSLIRASQSASILGLSTAPTVEDVISDNSLLKKEEKRWYVDFEYNGYRFQSSKSFDTETAEKLAKEINSLINGAKNIYLREAP